MVCPGRKLLQPASPNPKSWFPTDPQEIQRLSQNYFNTDALLLPFRSAKKGEVGTLGKDGWWTCNTSYSTSTYGYSYKDADVSDALKDFSDKYGWSIRWQTGDQFGKCPSDMLPYDMFKAQVFSFSESDLKKAKFAVVEAAVQAVSSSVPSSKIISARLPQLSAQKTMKADVVAADRAISTQSADDMPIALEGDVGEANVARSWYVDMEVERLALNDNFAINYFTGRFGDDPTKYLIEKELAGQTNVFAAPVQACDNCGLARDGGVIVTDTADITPILFDYIDVGQLQSLS